MRYCDRLGSKRAELRMNASSDETWMNSASRGFKKSDAANATPAPVLRAWGPIDLRHEPKTARYAQALSGSSRLRLKLCGHRSGAALFRLYRSSTATMLWLFL